MYTVVDTVCKKKLGPSLEGHSEQVRLENTPLWHNPEIRFFFHEDMDVKNDERHPSHFVCSLC